MTHLVFESVARRLDAGTYSAAVARSLRGPATVPSRPAARPFALVATTVAPYLGAALLGAFLALAYGVTP